MRKYDFCAAVDYCENGVMHLTVRNFFTLNDELELVIPHREPIKFSPKTMFGENGEEIDTARHAMEKITVLTDITAPPRSLIRKKIKF